MDRTDRRSLDLRGLWIPLCIAAMAVCVGTAFAAPFGPAQRTPDVRILMDVSGSMTVADPDNRRVAALRLVTGLLPETSRAGVWTIDQDATVLVPLGMVDGVWKRNAWDAAGQIHADGRSAHIEDAIRAATQDWQVPDARYDRHLIVLIDGHIDVFDSRSDNEASRRRVVGELLDRLQVAGATVHGIGLSDGADHQLLRHLAAATDGRYEYLEKATHLDRAFLNLFVNSVVANGLPLRDNQIYVDGSVDKFTFVAFTSPRSPKVSLVTPAAEIIDALTSGDNVTWRSEQGYDLVTVAGPTAGVWKIRGQADPDNLVVIASPLTAEIAGLANDLPATGSRPVYLRILRNGRPVRDRAFLDTLTVNVSSFSGGEMRQQWIVYDDGRGSDEQAGDGIFSIDIDPPADADSLRLVITVDGVSFQRSLRRLSVVREIPVIATLFPDRNGNTGEYELSVIPYGALLSPDSLVLAAKMIDAEGSEQDFTVPRIAGTAWQQRIRVAADAGRHEIFLTVTGNAPGGEEKTFHLEPLAFEGQRVLASEVIGMVRRDRDASDERDPLADGRNSNTAGGWFGADELEIRDVGWLTVAWQVLLVNLVILGAGYGAYRFWMKRQVVQNGAVPATAGSDTADDDAVGSVPGKDDDQ